MSVLVMVELRVRRVEKNLDYVYRKLFTILNFIVLDSIFDAGSFYAPPSLLNVRYNIIIYCLGKLPMFTTFFFHIIISGIIS